MKQYYAGPFQSWVIFLMLLGATSGSQAQVLHIPYDATSVTVDGTLHATEWQVAQRLFIRNGMGDSIAIQLKHDGNNLHVAFIGNLESANALFPEVLIDPQLSRSNTWMAGQWWLHVSATDCEHNGGAYGVYDNCRLVQPDWEGAPNFVSGAPFTDTVEMKIPFIKIAFDPSVQDTMGLAFVATNTFSAWHIWPGSADRNVPATWSMAVISRPAAAVGGSAGSDAMKVFPNPAREVVTIESPSNDGSERSFQLREVTGRLCYAAVSRAVRVEIPTAELPAGLYIVTVQSGDHHYRYKVSKAGN